MTDPSPDPAGAAGPEFTGTTGFQEIPLAAVDLTDHAFVMPPAAADSNRLIAAIREVGLLAPPWLRQRPDGNWQLVAGLKRLLAAVHLGWERIAARTLAADAQDSHCLLVALYDNAFTRGFNLREQATLAVRLLAHWDPATVAARYLPYLGLPPSGAVLARLQALAALEPPFLDLAARGRLALTAGAALGGWSPEDRATALPFLEALWLSQSKQEQFIEEVALLARREETTPGAILGRRELQEILSAPSSNAQERTAAVRRRLEHWVYPRLAAARAAFKAALSRLGLEHHPRLHLAPPAAFEGPDFHLEIKFRDAPEFKELLQELNRLAAGEGFAGLMHF